MRQGIIFKAGVALLALGIGLLAVTLNKKQARPNYILQRLSASGAPAAESTFQHFSEREETKGSYPLQDGARVWIENINGVVEIEETDLPEARVEIVRSVNKREDFIHHLLRLEHDPFRLLIRAEKDYRHNI